MCRAFLFVFFFWGIMLQHAQSQSCTSSGTTCVNAFHCRGFNKNYTFTHSNPSDQCEVYCKTMTSTEASATSCVKIFGAAGGRCLHEVSCPYRPIHGLCEGFTADVACCVEPGSSPVVEPILDANTLWEHDAAAAHLHSATGGNFSFAASASTCHCRLAACTSLEGLQGFAMLGLAHHFQFSRQCHLKILTGTEPSSAGSPFGDVGLETASRGYVVEVADQRCISDSILTKGGGEEILLDSAHPLSTKCSVVHRFEDSTWCKKTSTSANPSWEIVFHDPRTAKKDISRDPYAQRSEESLRICVDIINGLRDQYGRKLFPRDDFGMLLRMGESCPYTPGVGLGSGGIFRVTKAQFEKVQALLCKNSDYVQYRAEVQRIIGEVDICALTYTATESCIISALVARATLDYFTGYRIPELRHDQTTLWREVFQPPIDCKAFQPFESVPCQRMNIVILLDESGSVGRRNFQSALSALQQFAQDPGLQESNARIALVTYSSTARRRFPYKTPAEAAQLFPTISYGSGGTRTDRGIDEALKLFPTASLDSNDLNLLVTMTDGRTNDGNALPPAVERIPPGVHTFAVGIANAVYDELVIIAKGNADRVVEVSSFESFVENMALIRIRLCSAVTILESSKDPTIPDCNCIEVKTEDALKYVELTVPSDEILDLSLNLPSEEECFDLYVSNKYQNPGPGLYDMLFECVNAASSSGEVGRVLTGSFDPLSGLQTIGANPVAQETLGLTINTTSTTGNLTVTKEKLFLACPSGVKLYFAFNRSSSGNGAATTSSPVSTSSSSGVDEVNSTIGATVYFRGVGRGPCYGECYNESSSWLTNTQQILQQYSSQGTLDVALVQEISTLPALNFTCPDFSVGGSLTAVPQPLPTASVVHYGSSGGSGQSSRSSASRSSLPLTFLMIVLLLSLLL